MNTNTANPYPRAAIVARFIGPTNHKPARISVQTQRGRKVFQYDHEGTSSDGAPFKIAVAQYLESIAQEDKAKYGPEATGWGELSDYAHGVLDSGDHVFVSLTK